MQPPFPSGDKQQDMENIFRFLDTLRFESDNDTVSVVHDNVVLISVAPVETTSNISAGVSGDPFQLSLKIINNDQFAEVTSGVIFTDSQNFIPSGLVDLSSYSIDDTIYIYLKVETEWFNGNDLKNFPDLTVLTDANTTNFYGNSSVFPATDEDNLFYQVGTISVTDDGEGNKVYSIIEQIAKENITIEPLDLNGFSLVKFLIGKTNDIDVDSSYSLTMNKGNAKLPDNSNIEIPSTSKNVAIASKEYVDLKISATLNADGFFGSFLAVSGFSSTANEDTTTDVYFNIGTLDSGTITQNQIGNFVSDGRVW